MTPPERASLRTALIITLALYAAIFAAIEIWNPLGADRRAEATARPGGSGVVTLHLQFSANAAPARGPAPIRGAGSAADSTATLGASSAAASPSASTEAATPAARLTAAGSRADRSPEVGPQPSSTAHDAPRTSPPAAAQHQPLLPAGTAPPRDAGSAQDPSRKRAAGREPQHIAEPGSASAAGGEAILGGAATDAGSGQAQAGGSTTAAAADAGSLAAASGGRDPAAILAIIRARIEEARAYPPAAQSRDIEGSVRLLAEIGADGRLTGSRVLDSSGSKILDHAGLSLLRSVFPVPNPLGYAFNLEVTIAYRLNGGGPQ